VLNFDYDGQDGRKTGVKGYPDREATLKEKPEKGRIELKRLYPQI
jgi:hypothetical protein